MDKMALYILENFEWYWREVVFPPLPLPYNYRDLFLKFDLVAVEEATGDFHLPQIPQVVFCAMLPNGAMKLGVLHGWMTDMMESALKEALGLVGCVAGPQPLLGAKRVVFRPSGQTPGPDAPLGAQGGNDSPLGRASSLLTLFGSFKDSSRRLGRAIMLSAIWRLGPGDQSMGRTIGPPVPCGDHRCSENNWEIKNVQALRVRG
ncbi:hypothetical protein Cgig2_019227 [Carnegiea gigantea]|uniref:Uncharacterized protein n=1 Tax=Carnegiea gigantea TaxID=171969 RepID=A0A9Q1Q7Z4_9CARY|nr:hypothetical protein Cgig2_019227 [Carnegiea gigantea]